MSERILIVSDTHGRLNYFKEMLARTGKPDRLIHLGDSEGQQDEIARLAGCPVDIVRGNCDYSSDLAQDARGGQKYGMQRARHHGAAYTWTSLSGKFRNPDTQRGGTSSWSRHRNVWSHSRADYQSGKGCHYLKSRKFNSAASGWFCQHIYIDGN